MTTERSDKLHADWRASTEKFDYFMLGVICALCAFIAQGYKPSRLGLNATTLELIALLILVLSVVAGFRRVEKTLLVTAYNQRELHALEARGGMVAKLQEGRVLLNQATGQMFTPPQATARVAELTAVVQDVRPRLEEAMAAAHRQYKLRNALALAGFLLLLLARVWSAYA